MSLLGVHYPAPPIYSLPSEVLLMILKAVHSDIEELPYDLQSQLVAVSHVSRLWRNLALSTSAFWTFISVSQRSLSFDHPDSDEIEDPYTISESTIFPWITTLLNRSGNRLLDVEIDLQIKGFNAQDSDAKNLELSDWTRKHSIVLSRLLAARASQLRSVEISSQLWQLIPPIVYPLAGVAMPSLQEWSTYRITNQLGFDPVADDDRKAFMPPLQGPNSSDGVDVSRQNRGGELYTNLSILRLYGVFQDWNKLLPRNLVEIDLEHISGQYRPSSYELRALLLANQQTLKSLTLWAALPFDDDEREKFTLPNLNQLSIGFFSPEAAVYFASCLNAPNLEYLEIYDMISEDPANFLTGATLVEAETFLQELYAIMIDEWPLEKLRRLSLRSPYFRPDYLPAVDLAFMERQVDPPLPVILEFLFRCTSLEHIELHAPDVTTLVSLVTPVYFSGNSKAIIPCPGLKKLSLHDSHLPYIQRFLYQNSFCAFSSSDISGRQLEEIHLVNAPPEWGVSLQPCVYGLKAGKVVNNAGFFKVNACTDTCGCVRDFDDEYEFQYPFFPPNPPLGPGKCIRRVSHLSQGL
ncbi:hypothetical protein D9757_006547 [Collybiopsis confluens]|uniref:F-box domain-containing protein n=1 Tax=Collybiopsis confluens TaxID=2823264 RepID=A0A8H5HQW2_9AGAR|nr:hypothetical protein D9757_006547 [Collybiopsis confluens]